MASIKLSVTVRSTLARKYSAASLEAIACSIASNDAALYFRAKVERTVTLSLMLAMTPPLVSLGGGRIDRAGTGVHGLPEPPLRWARRVAAPPPLGYAARHDRPHHPRRHHRRPRAHRCRHP